MSFYPSYIHTFQNKNLNKILQHSTTKVLVYKNINLKFFEWGL